MLIHHHTSLAKRITPKATPTFAPYQDGQNHHGRLLKLVPSWWRARQIDWLSLHAPSTGPFDIVTHSLRADCFWILTGLAFLKSLQFYWYIEGVSFFTNLSMGPMSPSWSCLILQSSFEIVASLTWTCPECTKSPASQSSGIAQQFFTPLVMVAYTWSQDPWWCRFPSLSQGIVDNASMHLTLVFHFNNEAGNYT